ncbi:hypothetical protein AB0J71_02860 [Nonomuraea sp. NPDC049637]|uniref:hypothetical protein n=1 Tax=Nonomuraea sp. NPDC049637 TaxID=3154356 RepID=UPI003438395D
MVQLVIHQFLGSSVADWVSVELRAAECAMRTARSSEPVPGVMTLGLLLDVGPTGSGAFPPQAVERLEAFTGWMERHAGSVHDVRPGLALWQFHGRSAERTLPDSRTRIHLYLIMRPYEGITVRGLPVARIREVRMLGTGQAPTGLA